MILKIRTRRDSDRNASVAFNNEIWGILPAKILLSLYSVPCEYEISDDEASVLKNQLFEAARTKLLDYLAKQERSEKQAKDYLQRYLFHSSIIEDAISSAKEYKYIDNERYADILIRSLTERNKSRTYIINKLYEQNIPAHIYEPLLEEYTNPEELKLYLGEQINILTLRYKDIEPVLRKQKIVSSLYRKGFDLDLINHVYRIHTDACKF